MYKRQILTVMVILMMLFATTGVQADNQSVIKERRTVQFSGGSKTVDIVWANLNDRSITIETGLAGNGVGVADSLDAIVESQTDDMGKAIAGINGSFFNAYADLQPAGTLVENGEVRHIMDSGSQICVDANNNVDMQQLEIKITGSLNGSYEWPNKWYAWGINHFSTNQESIIIFDSHYKGVKPEHTFTGIVVDRHKIINIQKGIFDIPENGYLILTNNQELLGKVNVGDLMDYKFDIVVKGTSASGNYRSVVGAGPTLVNNGIVVLDALGEGFREEKIVTNRAQRSIIGVTADKKLAMFTLSNVSLNEAAEICINLGLKKAINLDGGASSGLYYNGGYITKPSRKISNAIVIKQLDTSKIKVILNGENLYFDVQPFVDQNSRTLVPLRQITEAIDGEISYEDATKSIVIIRNNTIIKLQVGNNIADVNGTKVIMDTVVTVKDGRSFVPVRYITEYFGGAVGWDGPTKTVLLTIEDAI